jgi:hypothetical protein
MATFLEEVLAVADEYERKGWLHKYRHHETGEEMWELTPLGRRELNLPPPLRQDQ